MKCEQGQINASSIAQNVSTEALSFALNMSKNRVKRKQGCFQMQAVTIDGVGQGA
jgi:hypothetical protein